MFVVNGRVNFSKCTPNGLSTLVSASLVSLAFKRFILLRLVTKTSDQMSQVAKNVFFCFLKCVIKTLTLEHV